MKVLFIGGSGNISTECSRLAVARGIELTVLNRGQHKTSLPDGVCHLQGDVTDRAAVARLLDGRRFDVVVNWIVFDTDQASADLETFAGKVDQYVFISTATVYQKPPRHYVVTEDAPLENPHWEYSQKKIAVEHLMADARRRGFPVTVVRPSFTYGDTWVPTAFGVDYTPIWRLRRGLPLLVQGDGTSLWQMTHASDFARGLVGLLGNPKAVGEAFHITSDEVLSWNQIFAAIGRAAGVEPKLVHVPTDFVARVNPRIAAGLYGDKAHSFVFDNSKIRRFVPEFRCTVPFEEGIRRTVAYLDGHPEEQRIEANAAVDEILAAWNRAMEA